jgi:hypothetical protein
VSFSGVARAAWYYGAHRRTAMSVDAILKEVDALSVEEQIELLRRLDQLYPDSGWHELKVKAEQRLVLAEAKE